MSKFLCPRTCTQSEWCKFRPILDWMGPVKVNSHTVSVKTTLKCEDVLQQAVAALGGKWLGHGCHKLYQEKETGIGFQLPGWRYPIVVMGEQIKYDDYNGLWGNPRDLEKLTSEYTLILAMKKAQELGWACERNKDMITIYHPSGGTLTVTKDGIIDANKFVGTGCHDAITQLDLGKVVESQVKPDFYRSVAWVKEGGVP